MLLTETCYYIENQVFGGATNQDMSLIETCFFSRLYGMSTLRIWFEQVLFIDEFELIYNSVGGNSIIQLTLLCSGPALQSHGGKSHNDMHSRLHCNRESFFYCFTLTTWKYLFSDFTTCITRSWSFYYCFTLATWSVSFQILLSVLPGVKI